MSILFTSARAFAPASDSQAGADSTRAFARASVEWGGVSQAFASGPAKEQSGGHGSGVHQTTETLATVS